MSMAVAPLQDEGVDKQPLQISGHVVDAETGKPVEQFVEQSGRVDPKDSTKIIWGMSEGRGFYRDDPSRLHTTVDWKDGWRVRILANGYLPEPVLTTAPAKGVHEVAVTVRLKRGEAVRGQVVDYAGKAVAGAAVFLCVDRLAFITEGKAVAWHQRVEDQTVTRTVTDSDGRFTLWGAAQGPCWVAVSTLSLDLWARPASPRQRDLVIQLPRPGRLALHYDIEGAEPEGKFLLEFLTAKKERWAAQNEREPKVANKGSRILANLAPGKYSLSRTKTLKGRGTFLCEVRTIEVESDKTTDVRFARDRGQSIEGRVVIPDKKAKFYVVFWPANASEEPFSRDNLGLPIFTAAACREDGTFRTERIAPGEYKIIAEGYLPEDFTKGFYTGVRLPDFVGASKITVPEVGTRGAVVIQMKRRQNDQ
jgi:hypothetical protein